MRAASFVMSIPEVDFLSVAPDGKHASVNHYKRLTVGALFSPSGNLIPMLTVFFKYMRTAFIAIEFLDYVLAMATTRFPATNSRSGLVLSTR